jgi:endoglucanase
MRRTLLTVQLSLYTLLLSFALTAAPPQTTYHIKVDQFGYLTLSRKVAVIADPQVGFNSAESFIPGTGANQYQVRRWDDDAIVFTGTLQAWNGGATHTQSGDKGWWFDFSSVTTPGSYYVFDVVNNVGSFRFEIGDNVYEEVLKHALRTYFYQRINFAKQFPYTDPKWADGACFEGSNQDRFATSRFDKGNMATAKDVHGGWMDAGDLNKYTTFANSAVIQLAEAYRINPGVFLDNNNIPESGNGIPDIMDELKFELDFLKRMQDATGTNGFLLKVGVDNYNEVTPPSTDMRPRYYLPECTSATLSGCAMFAVTGVVMKEVAALNGYGLDLIARAELAWARAKVTTNNFTSYQLACDDGDIKSGDADNTAEQQLENAFVAAVYLYEATGNIEYRTFAETNYVNVNPYKINWWGPYWMPQQIALLRLTSLPGISSTVVNNIRNQKANMDYQYSIPTYNMGTDLYRAHMSDDAFHWGHNQARTGAGHMNMDYITFNLNPTNHAQYREVAEQYLHWMHGVNPMGMVMLSNMYNYGAEKCANEIYHTWFTHNSIWDNSLTSPNGPAPGYVPGGPNKSYTGSVSGITNQPPQKAYKDWNTGFPENSWEITEPSIYCQASYVMLLARLMPATGTPPPPTDTVPPTTPLNLVISNVTETGLTLSWYASTDNIDVTGYEVYQGTVLLNGNVATTSYQVSGLTCATSYSFTVKAKDAAGNVSSPSDAANATTSTCIILTTKVIYDDVTGVDWSDVSTGSTRNFTNSNPVKAGIRSIRVDYLGSGTLSFLKGTAVNTAPTTQLRFWVYNTENNSIRIFTEASDNGGQSSEVTVRPSRKKWVEVVVTMAQLGNPAVIKKVTIQNAATSSTTMYFDDIRLVNVSDPEPQPRAAVTGAAELKQEVHWSVYPNPASDVLIVTMNTHESRSTAELIDAGGRSVLRKEINTIEGVNKLSIPLPPLVPGVYYFRIITATGGKAVPIMVK